MIDIKLVEHLQRVNEEDLFPNASKRDIEARKEEQRIKNEKLLNSFKIGDRVKIGTGIAIITNIWRTGTHRFPYGEIQISFGGKTSCTHVRPDEIEKVTE